MWYTRKALTDDAIDFYTEAPVSRLEIAIPSRWASSTNLSGEYRVASRSDLERESNTEDTKIVIAGNRIDAPLRPVHRFETTSPLLVTNLSSDHAT